MTTEVLIRVSAFLGMLSLMTSWEVLVPRRCLTISKVRRWVANLSVVVIAVVIIRLLFTAGAVGAALLATEQNWGFLNHSAWPIWIEMVPGGHRAGCHALSAARHVPRRAALLALPHDAPCGHGLRRHDRPPVSSD